MMAMSIVTEDKMHHDVERRPIDLVHLAKQTLGDRSLETEVLRLFMTQADVYMKRVEQANDDDTRFAAAHTIKGSARNIGAWIVADAAAEVETAKEAKITADIAALKEALSETCFFISGILEEA
ncbi:MAG: Hpt domain-containing protein [Hyphomicrobiales bacterium]